MSLYNMAVGIEPTAGAALEMLKLQAKDVPRFRDAFFDWADAKEETPVIVIRTRTGGGGRNAYREQNATLTALTGYLSDRDDTFDTTFADFFYTVPADYHDRVCAYLGVNGRPLSLKAKFDALARLSR